MVAAPGKMSREEKSKIIRPLIKKGLKNKEIAERTGIPLGTVNGLSGPIRKELKNPVKPEMTVREIREIRTPDPEPEEEEGQLPGQMSDEDLSEVAEHMKAMMKILEKYRKE